MHNQQTLNMLQRVAPNMQYVLDSSWEHPTAPRKHTQQRRITIWTKVACLPKQLQENRGCFGTGYSSRMRHQNEKREYNVERLSSMLQPNVHTLKLKTYDIFWIYGVDGIFDSTFVCVVPMSGGSEWISDGSHKNHQQQLWASTWMKVGQFM